MTWPNKTTWHFQLEYAWAKIDAQKKRIEELEHAIRDAEITLCNDDWDVRVDNALSTLRGVLEEFNE